MRRFQRSSRISPRLLSADSLPCELPSQASRPLALLMPFKNLHGWYKRFRDRGSKKNGTCPSVTRYLPRTPSSLDHALIPRRYVMLRRERGLRMPPCQATALLAVPRSIAAGRDVWRFFQLDKMRC